jgi:gamma-glutamyl:cysteine ligase YbdK (ATP-grasp superfamily)
MNSLFKNIAEGMHKKTRLLKRRVFPYRLLEVLGPEHEYSIVDEELKPLPISDRVMKDFYGEIVDFVYLPKFIFGKESVMHQLEIKAKEPFRSPELFEEDMQCGVTTLLEFLSKKYHAQLLGTGMHPTLGFEDTYNWPYSNQDVLRELKRLFDFKRHGWLNTQSYQLNLPFGNEKEAIKLYNALTQLCPYLPAITASSPICEGSLDANVDNRLYYYKIKTQEISSIAGDVVPEYITSLAQFQRDVVGKYSQDLANAGAGEKILHAEWMDQRGLIFKFSREAIEIRVMDEQECIKSDVALSCFIRAAVRGLIATKHQPPPHELLVTDYNSIVKNGSNAEVTHPEGKEARQVCQYFFNLALEHANEDEKKYLWIVQKRIKEGSLSELIRDRVSKKAQKTTFKEAVASVYTQLIEALADNQPYF